MSKVQKKAAAKTAKRVVASPFSIYWEKNNYIFLLAGAAALFIGFYFLSSGTWDSTASQIVAPVILLVVYLIVFPLAIFYGPRFLKKSDKSVDAGQSQG